MTKGVTFRPEQRGYDDYYCKQAGYGLPVFVGGRHQRGRGLGSIFGGIARSLFPLLKSGAKTLLREGAKTGVQVASDVISGQNVKKALRRRAGESGKRLLNKAVSRFTGSSSILPPPPLPPGRIKRRRSEKRKQKPRKKRRKNIESDIFN